jgi:hypothetical protein
LRWSILVSCVCCSYRRYRNLHPAPRIDVHSLCK